MLLEGVLLEAMLVNILLSDEMLIETVLLLLDLKGLLLHKLCHILLELMEENQS